MENIIYYDSKEENLNVISHAIGLVLSIIALILLVIYSSKYGSAKHIISFSIYGVSLIVLYAASTFYHNSKTSKLRQRLNIIDHASIYVLIAGTYTPFTMVILEGWVGWTIFGISWGLAFTGIILKLFYTGKYDRISTIAYVLIGWLIVFALKPLINNFPFNGLMWLLTGGVLYTIGAVLYRIKSIKYNHFIFHVFVLLASISHFIAVFFYILPK